MSTNDLIKQWIWEACKANNLEYVAKEISFFFNPRKCKHWLGRAFHNRIELSSYWWPRITIKSQEKIVKHETCHIIGYVQTEKMGHDRAFHQAMIKCGYSHPKRFTETNL